ncbi:MAG: hypothetical protein JNL12_02320 [Planctomycetes bacterium]|nr:hypothetical protein [Planctomycetota bacterium]
MHRLLPLLFLLCALPAQLVRVANFSGAPYAGWKRTTIDVAPPHLVGRVGGPGFGRALALRGAKAVLRDGEWVSHDHVAIDGRKGTSSSFYLFGTPGAVAVVLRHEPENAQAKAILQPMLAAGGTTWMPPQP